MEEIITGITVAAADTEAAVIDMAVPATVTAIAMTDMIVVVIIDRMVAVPTIVIAKTRIRFNQIKPLHQEPHTTISIDFKQLKSE